MSKKHKVFTYGTLRPSNVATHTLRGYSMYNYGNRFPYIKQDQSDVMPIQGNVVEVSRKELMLMDKYESVPRGLYKREEAEVWNILEEAMENVFVYVAGPALLDRRVTSGDWFNR